MYQQEEADQQEGEEAANRQIGCFLMLALGHPYRIGQSVAVH